MDGGAHLDEPRKQEQLMSPRGEGLDVVSGLEAGADDYVVKPVDMGRYGRWPERLRSTQATIGLALAGRAGARMAGARMAGAFGVAASRSTVLRLVQALPDPEPPAPRVVDVDEYATCKGANVINPVPIDTGWMSTEMQESCITQTPLARLGTPQETARLVDFPHSPQGQWTGQRLRSNGGFAWTRHTACASHVC